MSDLYKDQQTADRPAVVLYVPAEQIMETANRACAIPFDVPAVWRQSPRGFRLVDTNYEELKSY